MTYANRIKHLVILHDQLNVDIDKMERNHPHVEEFKLAEMKKRKLLLKDEINRLARVQWQEEHETVDFHTEDR